MFLRAVLLPGVAALCLLLSACGRSSGGGQSVAASPELVLSTTAVTEKATIAQAEGPTAIIGLTPHNAPSDAYIGYAYSTDGVATIVGNLPVRAPTALIVTFQPPYQLKPATYTDSLQIQLCADAECTQPLTQRQFVTLTYVVGAAPAGQTPSVMLSTTSISAQQFLTSMPHGFPQAPSVILSFANVPAQPQVTTSSTHNGVENVVYSAANGNLATFLQPPQALGAGTYHDTVTINSCLDTGCENPLPPVTLSVTYTVTNMVGGAAGYTINAWPITATDILWDAINSQLLVSLPPSRGISGSIDILDATSGALSSPTSVAGTPSVMAIASDSSFLYVGLAGASSVQRYLLPGMTPDIAIALPVYNGTATFARTLAVAPDNAHTLAVTMQDGTGNPLGLVIFDDATARVNTFGFVNTTPVKIIDSAVWGATGAALYGTSSNNGSGQAAELYAFTVDASGVTLAIDQSGAPGGREHFAQNLLYLDGGAIVDPATLMATGTFAAPQSNLLMTPDLASGRAFFLNTAPSSSSFSGAQFESYDLNTQTSIASVPLPNGNPTSTRLVRWGTAGLAFVDAGNADIITLSGSFVSP